MDGLVRAFPTTDDRLLEISATLKERADATTLDWQEIWGKRSLAGRFMAYSDADRTLSQLKSYCESGKVCARQARSAGSALSLFSAFITVATFALLIGWEMAILLASILVIHEFGHGIHGVFSRQQTDLLYDCPIPMAETASIVSPDKKVLISALNIL